MTRYAAVLMTTLLALPATGAVRAAEAPYGAADFARVEKFDAHVHANAPDPVVLRLARQDRFELLSINVDYPDFPSLETQAAAARALRAMDPGRFFYATTFSMRGWEAPGWADAVTQQLTEAVQGGAVAVKVWKNVGMVERDAKGQLLSIDDARLAPVFNRIDELGVPLIAHQGEPYNCWLPLDKMTTDNDRSYFREHPQYHMYLHPEQPSHETLMAARDRVVAAHPGLRVVGAHLASLEWDVDVLAGFLDRYPNTVVDMAARMTQLQYQSLRDRERVRRFLIRYQDRILYGSDLSLEPGATAAAVTKEWESFWRSDWLYLATGDAQTVEALHARVPGLALPRSVVRKIYYENAHRVFTGLQTTG